MGRPVDKKARVKAVTTSARTVKTDYQPRRSRVVTLSGVDVCVGGYKARRVKDGWSVEVRSVILEHITHQYRQLLNVGHELMLGDRVRLDTYFGHEDSDGTWIDLPLRGDFRVRSIIIESELDQIRLVVTPSKFRVRC